MNRKSFLASLVGLAAVPFVGKYKATDTPVQSKSICKAIPAKIKGVVLVNKEKYDGLSIVEACEKIRREAEKLAIKHYPFL